MSTPQIKFQQLLRELFQFDCADLDFGIYRIMNFKRASIEGFISEDLPRLWNVELIKGALAAQRLATHELDAGETKGLEACSVIAQWRSPKPRVAGSSPVSPAKS